ncbi:hypothetical protein AALA46_27690 [Enterocloster aldenensis]|uniref:hypothetical protein n=1 Tax=Enterocloster aldenensis TaxID=358742 RepID=UPI003510FD4E
MDYITTDTKDWAFATFAHMSKEEFSMELKILVSVRNLYLYDRMVDSFVFEYLDSVYDIARDVLVCKCIG